MLMFLKKTRKNKKGFTLTELIVVVAILGVLAAVATPAVMGYVQDARDNADAANAKVIENCMKIAATNDVNNSFVDANGAILAAHNTAALIIAAANADNANIPASLIQAADGTLVACQNTNNHFVINRATLAVRVGAAAAGETQLD